MSLRVQLFPRADADLKKQYAWYLSMPERKLRSAISQSLTQQLRPSLYIRGLALWEISGIRVLQGYDLIRLKSHSIST